MIDLKKTIPSNFIEFSISYFHHAKYQGGFPWLQESIYFIPPNTHSVESAIQFIFSSGLNSLPGSCVRGAGWRFVNDNLAYNWGFVYLETIPILPQLKRSQIVT